MIDLAGSAEPLPPPPVTPRAWPVHLAVAGVSVLAGVALAVGALLLAGWRYAPVHRYEVAVVMKAEATAAQRDAARDLLVRAAPDAEIRAVTREELFEGFRAKWEVENAGELPESVTPALMQERVVATINDRSFDCGMFAGVKNSPGVADIGAERVHGETGRTSGIVCR